MASIEHQSVAADSRRAELARVLASDLFSRAPVLGHFLSYLCDKSFTGHTNEIKEYSIAVDVFGRDPSFDQDSDSIVRVHANRLRKRLAQYYATTGSTDPVEISIPIGQYVPVFTERPLLAPAEAQPEIPPLKLVELTAIETRQGRRWRFVAIASLVVIAVLITAGVLLYKRTQSNRPSTVGAQSAPDLPVGLPVGDEIRISAGATNAYVDRSGKVWSADAYFTGGDSVRSTVQHIWRTQDSSLYRKSRQGDFSYEIPLKPGVYEMRLHFAETFYGPEEVGGGGEGSRLINVSANGVPLLTNFDIMADAGASRTSDVKVFTDIAPASDGKLHLKFSSPSGGPQAIISAIEILPGVRGRIRPIRIATRPSPYYSIDSRWWGPDNYYKGGQLSESQEPVLDTDDPELYQTERWGNFSYSISVPPGKYDITLHFVKRRFGPAPRPAQASHGEDGRQEGRVFNVFCNGKMVLRDFNILKQAGENRPVVKTLSAVEPNAQGKLVLDFVPVHDYATVTAIEVIPH